MSADLKAARARLEQFDGLSSDTNGLALAIETLLTALDQAAEALKPFEAVMREHYEDLPPDPRRHAWGFNGADLYWRDFIRAATVYATLKPEEG